MALRQGNMGKPDRQPADRRGLRQRRHPASAITPFARSVLDGPAGADPRRHLEQLRHAAGADGREQQVRHQGRPAVRQPARARFFRFSHRKVEQLRAAADPRRDEQPVQRLRRSAQPAVGARRHAARCRPLAARSARRPVSDQGRQDGARHRRPRTCSSATASPGCRPTKSSAAASPSRR